MLSEIDRTRVEAAITQAESGTAGEIVLVLARRAASYRSVPLLYALLVALAIPWPLMWLTTLETSRLLLVQLLAALVALLVTSPEVIRHRLVPSAIRHSRAREAAQRAFAELGMSRTLGRTGVLIYLVQAERHVEVLGDVSIAPHVDDAEWRAIITDLVAGLRGGGAADALVGAINRIGLLLAQHAPADARNPDELPNRIVEI